MFGYLPARVVTKTAREGREGRVRPYDLRELANDLELRTLVSFVDPHIWLLERNYKQECRMQESALLSIGWLGRSTR